MAPRIIRRSRRKHRIVSISLDPSEADWIDTLVQLLDDNGYPKAARSEVVRMAVLELRQSLRTRTTSDVVRWFLQRDAERAIAALIDTDEPPQGPDVDPLGRDRG